MHYDHSKITWDLDNASIKTWFIEMFLPLMLLFCLGNEQHDLLHWFWDPTPLSFFYPLQSTQLVSLWTLVNHPCQTVITQRTHKNICWEYIWMFQQWSNLSKIGITSTWLHVILEDAHQPWVNSASGNGLTFATVHKKWFLRLELRRIWYMILIQRYL